MRPGELLADRFEITELAGRGGMGNVFRATDRTTGGTVAIKVVGGEAADPARFAREVAHLARIDDPRIVRFVAHGVAAGQPYLAMEWVEGDSLAQRLEERGLTAAEAVAVASDAANALGALHRAGVVHRDVKPANLLFEDRDLGRMKLIDLGIARALDESRDLTQTGTLVGTPGYMSPEQARGEREVDARSDVFSLGCVLYECLTGWMPFAGEHSMAIRAKILFAEPPSVDKLSPEVPRELVALLRRMLAKSHTDRPADGDEVARALRALPAIPAGPARRTVGSEPHTVRLQHDPARDLLLLVAPRPRGRDPGELLAILEGALSIAAPTAPIARLEDGVVFVRIGNTGDPAELVRRCAQACRDVWPEVSIAIAGGDAIDQAVGQLVVGLLRPGTQLWLDAAAQAAVGAISL